MSDEASEQRCDENPQTVAISGEYVPEPSERGPERQHRRGAEAFSHKARRNLEAGQSAGKDRSHQPERGKAETELGLPDRQHNVDEIGVPVI